MTPHTPITRARARARLIRELSHELTHDVVEAKRAGYSWRDVTAAIVDPIAPTRDPFWHLPHGASETTMRRHYEYAVTTAISAHMREQEERHA